ncbi:ParB/RepB/Spo0J family partition protein [uncultured Roseicyclus sp.]|uniref:ParB/RepB/Spo0J family partition protein n=1 Tax=uncultured Roseicyclus sp. TaxID=543072 RepID=UPI0026164535|nr:ParB/RepB/Spo0J family partition protein [uncultured Roseicyclus sp.]
MVNKRERAGLGRGLSALMADIDTASRMTNDQDQASLGPRTLKRVPIDRINPNPDQPRRRFAQTALDELAASIREKGVIQPLIVRPDPNRPDAYQIVAGERRWRAAQQVQLHELPVVIRDFDDIEVLEIAIIENVQRADLNAMEEAQGYRQLIDRFGHTQEKLAQALGKSRSHIANMMRLLALPDEIQDLVRGGQLTAGHARALLTVNDPMALARKAVANGWSVRDVEKQAKPRRATTPRHRSRSGSVKDADTAALESDLSAAIGMPVSIEYDPASGEGRVSIKYKDLQALDDIVRLLGGG